MYDVGLCEKAVIPPSLGDCLLTYADSTHLVLNIGINLIQTLFVFFARLARYQVDVLFDLLSDNG